MSRVPPPKLAKSLSLATLLGAALAACAGPATLLDNPGRHRCYLDGVHEVRGHIPFRFYGTSRIFVIPADLRGRPDWEHTPTAVAVELAPPASPWLFPLDFLVEAYERTFHGAGDLGVEIAVAPVPAAQLPSAEAPPPGLDELTRRAHAARIAR